MKYQSSTGQRTIYVYDAEGELAAEYRTDTADPACTAGTPDNCTQFLMADHLGSTRVVMSRTGTVIGRYDYLPFGREVPGYLRSGLGGYGADLRMGVKYTGQMRDGESGLDYFGARYYSAVQGRFLSPDPENAGALEETPQSWHGYAYVMNNPMAYVDPSGLGPCPVDSETGQEQPCLEGLAYEYLWRQSWFGRQVLNLGAKASDWLSQPRDPGCMAAAMGASSAAGTRAGMVLGATSGGLTIPMGGGIGLIFGGASGYFAGLANCMRGSGSGSGTGNEPTPSAKRWQITNPAATKIVGGRTYLKDAKTGLWGSRDTAGHGGSAWKVYKEGPGGVRTGGVLKWFRDADAQGNFIDPSLKWKRSCQ